MEVKHTPERDKDILSLCQQVIEATPASHYNPNGADSTTCPFCSERVDYMDADMSDIKHNPTCAYLLAKDLSTGLITKATK